MSVQRPWRKLQGWSSKNIIPGLHMISIQTNVSVKKLLSFQVKDWGTKSLGNIICCWINYGVNQSMSGCLVSSCFLTWKLWEKEIPVHVIKTMKCRIFTWTTSRFRSLLWKRLLLLEFVCAITCQFCLLYSNFSIFYSVCRRKPTKHLFVCGL